MFYLRFCEFCTCTFKQKRLNFSHVLATKSKKATEVFDIHPFSLSNFWGAYHKVSDLLFFYNLIYYLFLPAKRETRPNTADVPTQIKEAMKRSLNTPLQPKLSAIVPKP